MDDAIFHTHTACLLLLTYVNQNVNEGMKLIILDNNNKQILYHNFILLIFFLIRRGWKYQRGNQNP
jgi:hypothetical protein